MFSKRLYGYNLNFCTLAVPITNRAMRNIKEENVLLIFVKNPELGQVKTRLAESVGAEKALEIYQRLLAHTKRVTDGLPCSRELWYSSYINNDDHWEEENYNKKLQVGDDLGERMQYAFEQSFKKGAEKVVIVGSDCAEITTNHIRRAFRGLQTDDIVIGPSKDGGYYLLGMSAFHPSLFENKEWSTSSVYRETIAEIQQKGLTYKELPQLNDIDTKDDLLKYEERF